MISQQTRPGTITLIATNDVGDPRIDTNCLPDKGVFVGSSSNCGLQLHDDGLERHSLSNRRRRRQTSGSRLDVR